MRVKYLKRNKDDHWRQPFLFSLLFCFTIQWQMQDLPGGAGAPTNNLTIFFQKLHENEAILAYRGWCIRCAPQIRHCYLLLNLHFLLCSKRRRIRGMFEPGPSPLFQILKVNSPTMNFRVCFILIAHYQWISYFTLSVPLEIPQNFRLNPDKEVTDTTADFIWSSVNTGAWRMQGFFRGYSVSTVRFLHIHL